MSVSGIYQLKLNIQTSIPGQESFVLTSDMLNYSKTVNKVSLDKYPYFSFLHKLPRRKLQGYTYDEILEFFFNYSIFKRKLYNRNVTRKKGGRSDTDKVGGKKSKMVVKSPAEQLKLRQSNFVLMLQLLFPTTIPVINNIDTSVGIITKLLDAVETQVEKTLAEDNEVPETNEVENIESFKKNPFDFGNIRSFFSLKGSNWFNIMAAKFNKRFSYLHLNNMDYTITRTIWINDIMNHPFYRDIINTFHEYDKKQNEYKNIDADKKFLGKKKEILQFVFEKIQEYPKIFRDLKDTDTSIFKPISTDVDYEQKIDKEFQLVSRSEKLGEVKAQIVELNEALKTPVNLTVFMFILPDIKDEKEKETILKKLRNNAKLTEEEEKALMDARKTKMEELLNQSEDTINEIFDELDRMMNFFLFIIENYSSNIPKMNPKYFSFMKDISKKFAEYNSSQSYEKYVNDMNFEYLTNPKLKDIATMIEARYPEFNNFVIEIQKMRGRLIDNPVWKKVIDDILKGSKHHNFKSIIWNKIDTCYQLSEAEKDIEDITGTEEDKDVEGTDKLDELDLADYSDDTPEEKKEKAAKRKEKKLEKAEKETEIEEQKKKRESGVCDIREPVLYVNFDTMKHTDPNTKESKEKESKFKMIELYLQMDAIEGKINETNYPFIKCNYTDHDLGNKWDLLMDSGDKWDVSNQMFYYSALKDLENIPKKNGAPGSGPGPSLVADSIKKGGKKRTTRRIARKK